MTMNRRVAQFGHENYGDIQKDSIFFYMIV